MVISIGDGGNRCAGRGDTAPRRSGTGRLLHQTSSLGPCLCTRRPWSIGRRGGYPDESLSAEKPSPAGGTETASPHAGSDPDDCVGSALKRPAGCTGEPPSSSLGRSTADHGRSASRSPPAPGKRRNRKADSRVSSRSSDTEGSTTPVLSEILAARLHRRVFRCRAQGLVVTAWCLGSRRLSQADRILASPSLRALPSRDAAGLTHSAVGPPPSPPIDGMMLSHFRPVPKRGHRTQKRGLSQLRALSRRR